MKTDDEKNLHFAPPIHPGEILQEDFLAPNSITPRELADVIGIDGAAIEGIISRTDPITPDIAGRLARFFGTTPELWLNMQALYDDEIAA
ncbi:HigA family addiction module antidote protein [Sinorhizobium meliloti]|nr:HigA family addiction module antidote protein [Sinorhizobium meliloti]